MQVRVEFDNIEVAADAEVRPSKVIDGQVCVRGCQPGAVLLGVLRHGNCLLRRATGKRFMPVLLETPLGNRNSTR